MSSRRVQYDRGCSVDVSNELEKLRKHYAELQHQKKMKEEDAMAKAMSATPSETQLRLYKQGMEKITALKINEEAEKANDPYALDVRSVSPSPICDRLYKEGMMKKLKDLRREQPSPSPSSRKREDAMAKAMSATPSETQLRLYKQGMEKITALKINEEAEKANDPYALDVRSVSPSPICDRLYKEGMMKKLKDLRREQPSPSPSSRKRNVKSSPIHNRLYEEGMQKVRARNLSTQSRRASKSPSVRGASPNGASERLYEQGMQKLRSRSPSEDPAKKDSIDRLYGMDTRKLRATSKNRIPLRAMAKDRIPTSSGKHETRATSKLRLPLGPGDFSESGRSPELSTRKAGENEAPVTLMIPF